LVNGVLQLRLVFWRQVINGDVHNVANVRHLDSTRCVVLDESAPHAKHTASRKELS
jgi:hypothetical protein